MSKKAAEAKQTPPRQPMPNVACGELIVAWKSKSPPTPEELSFIDSMVDVLNEPRPPESATLRRPGHRDWLEPGGCVRGPEEDDATFQRRVWANAEPLKEMMLRNKHNATTVEARTEAELAIESMGTPEEFQRLQQEKRYEEEDCRREEDKRSKAAAEARGLQQPWDLKAGAGAGNGEMGAGKAGSGGQSSFRYGMLVKWFKNHPAKPAIMVAFSLLILAVLLGWFVPPWRSYAWSSAVLVGLVLVILSRL